MKILEDKNFYPTPENLIEKMIEGFDNVKTILEPSAGKGDIIDYFPKSDKWKYERNLDIDCIEINPILQTILKDKKYRVVYDDFLKYKSYKRYDLIIMNPPFDNGDKHLLKALELQENGGSISCILNAETIRNPYSNTRKALLNKLEELDAKIEYIEDAFIDAERKTGVEIALIKVTIPEREFISDFFENIRKAKEHEEIEITEEQQTALVHTDFIKFLKSLIQRYNIEVEAGIKLIREYNAMKPLILDELKNDNEFKDYRKPIIELKVDIDYYKDPNVINTFIRKVRRKYWQYLFYEGDFAGHLTSNLQEEYCNKVEELEDYEFSLYNILTVKEHIQSNMIRGVEETILALFEELSNKYHYLNEASKNVHYYNGWKTNKCYKINDKVVIPFHLGYEKNLGHIYFSHIQNACVKMRDITKVFDYLDCGRTKDFYSIYGTVNNYLEKNILKQIPLKYFDVTFYKKGTCHITFKNKELLDKFNFFGSQQKGWLPPDYGKKPYNDMNDEEKEVVKEFSGSVENYNKIYNDQQYYIVNKQLLLENAS